MTLLDPIFGSKPPVSYSLLHATLSHYYCERSPSNSGHQNEVVPKVAISPPFFGARPNSVQGGGGPDTKKCDPWTATSGSHLQIYTSESIIDVKPNICKKHFLKPVDLHNNNDICTSCFHNNYFYFWALGAATLFIVHNKWHDSSCEKLFMNLWSWVRLGWRTSIQRRMRHTHISTDNEITVWNTWTFKIYRFTTPRMRMNDVFQRT